MIPEVRWVAILTAVVVATGTWWFWSPWIAERLLFFPDRRDPGPAPTLSGIEGVDVWLTAQDGVQLHGWWHEIGPDAPAVLLLHGNAGNIADRIAWAEAYLARGISIFMLDYRGYGRSQGRPSEAGVYLDAQAALEFVAETVGSTDRVVVQGRSLGGAVAAQIVLGRGVAGVILESTFTSLADIGRAVYPFLPSFAVRPLRGRFETRSAVATIDVPVLVTHGTRDDLIPFQMGRELYQTASEPKSWLSIEGAGHNDVLFVGGPRYLDRLAGFVRETVAAQ